MQITSLPDTFGYRVRPTSTLYSSVKMRISLEKKNRYVKSSFLTVLCNQIDLFENEASHFVEFFTDILVFSMGGTKFET